MMVYDRAGFKQDNEVLSGSIAMTIFSLPVCFW